MTIKKFCLSLHYNEANSYLFVKRTEIIGVKVKDSNTNPILLCQENISKDFFVGNMKNTIFYGYVYDVRVDYDAIAVHDILDLHKCLMRNNMIWNVWTYSKNVFFRRNDVF